jgi:hypothetical protein
LSSDIPSLSSFLQGKCSQRLVSKIISPHNTTKILAPCFLKFPPRLAVTTTFKRGAPCRGNSLHGTVQIHIFTSPSLKKTAVEYDTEIWRRCDETVGTGKW